MLIVCIELIYFVLRLQLVEQQNALMGSNLIGCSAFEAKSCDIVKSTPINHFIMIPVARPDIGDKELEQVKEAFDSGWIGLGPKVNEFEAKFGDQFNHENVIGTNSGTSALDLALKAADLSGTELLVPPITWISTAFVGWYNNLNIGWVDVRPETLNMSSESLRDRISEDTAAVIPVHYGGQPAEIDSIVDIAHKHDAVVIEDCAHAVGTTYRDEEIGTVGDMACFSFQATKPLTMGEGGAFITDNEDLASKARRMSKLGVDKSTHERSEEEGYSWYYEIDNAGYKYFMHDISAGIGLVQLDRLEETRTQRNKVAAAYNHAFSNLDWVTSLKEKEHTTHARYNYTIRVNSDNRNSLIQYLDDHGIGATVHYMPLYKHPVFNDHKPNLPITESVWEQIVTLPMSSTLTDEEVSRVISTIESYGRINSPRRPSQVGRGE